jgi:hypothetical protein
MTKEVQHRDNQPYYRDKEKIAYRGGRGERREAIGKRYEKNAHETQN